MTTGRINQVCIDINYDYQFIINYISLIIIDWISQITVLRLWRWLNHSILYGNCTSFKQWSLWQSLLIRSLLSIRRPTYIIIKQSIHILNRISIFTFRILWQWWFNHIHIDINDNIIWIHQKLFHTSMFQAQSLHNIF